MRKGACDNGTQTIISKTEFGFDIKTLRSTFWLDPTVNLWLKVGENYVSLTKPLSSGQKLLVGILIKEVKPVLTNSIIEEQKNLSKKHHLFASSTSRGFANELCTTT